MSMTVMKRNVWSFLDCSWMGGMTRSDYLGIEAILVICCVFHRTDGTVGFVKGIFTMNNIAIANFMLAFVVSCVAVGYAIIEFVFGMCLKPQSYLQVFNNNCFFLHNSRQIVRVHVHVHVQVRGHEMKR